MSDAEGDRSGREEQPGEGVSATSDPYPNGEPPGPSTLPFVGSALPFFRRPFAYRTAVADEYGDVVDVSGLGRRAFLVSHPAAIQRILVTDDELFVKPDFEQRFVERTFGNSLAFVDGEPWRRARRLFQPVFTVDQIGTYGETMVAGVDDLLADWPAAGTVSVDEQANRLTFQVLSKTLLGLDGAEIPDLHDDFKAVATKLRPAKAIVPDWLPTPTNRRYARALARIETVIDDLVAQRRRSPEAAGGEDLLSLLVRATDPEDPQLSDERLRDELMGFLFAGHETTAVALAFTLSLLARHPDEQERLRSTLEQHFDGDRPTVEGVRDVERLDHVIDEALRLYPPNHMIPREPIQDVAIRGYHVPAGSSVYCSQWVVHRDERWWDEPDRFRPDRWDRTDRPEYAFFPFGGGPRHCIGMRFARLELQLALARLIQSVRFDGAPSGEPELAAGLTIHTKGPLELRVRQRT